MIIESLRQEIRDWLAWFEKSACAETSLIMRMRTALESDNAQVMCDALRTAGQSRRKWESAQADRLIAAWSDQPMAAHELQCLVLVRNAGKVVQRMVGRLGNLKREVQGYNEDMMIAIAADQAYRHGKFSEKLVLGTMRSIRVPAIIEDYYDSLG